MKRASGIGERLGGRVSIKPLKGHPNGYKCRATYIEGGKRRQKYFKTRAAAERFKEDREEEAAEHGTSQNLTATERAAVIETREKLSLLGVSLRNAIETAIEIFELERKSATVEEMIASTIEERTRSGHSPRYLADLRVRLARFSKDFGSRAVATVTPDEISDWLHALGLKGNTANSFRRIIGVAFSDAVRRGFLSDNPVLKVMPVKVTEARYSALTPEEADDLIRCAPPEILPVIALGLFTGARDSELKQLRWNEIDLSGDEECPYGYVRISAEIAKSSRNRLIPVSENLAAILTPLVRKTGNVWPRNGRKLHEAARRAAGFDLSETGKSWPENALRHSFASHHLAHHRNPEALALLMGHTDTRLIFKHYRKLVRPDEAARYWRIGLI